MTVQQVPQRDEAWTKTASPEEIARAHAAGELAQLMGARVPRSFSRDTQLTEDDLSSMTPSEVDGALKAGALDELLGRKGV